MSGSSLRFEDFRRADGTIDLEKAFEAYREPNVSNVYLRRAWPLHEYRIKLYFQNIEALNPIRSRQAAAIALATAASFMDLA